MFAMASGVDGPLASDAGQTADSTDGAWRDLLSRAVPVRFAPGSVLFTEGDPAQGFFLLVSGRVAILWRNGGAEDDMWAVAGTGELLGDLSLSDRGGQGASATALDNVEALSLSRAVVREWLESGSEAWRVYLRLVTVRMGRQQDALWDIFAPDVSRRLARVVLRDARRFGHRTSIGIRVDLGLSQEQLARLVRASRGSVNKVLRSFVQQRWLRREGNELIVLDEERLAAHAGLQH